MSDKFLVKLASVRFPTVLDYESDGRPTGSLSEIVSTIGRSCHFNFTPVVPPSGMMGSMDENGRYDGFIGLIQNNFADLVAAPIPYATMDAPGYFSTTWAEYESSIMEEYPAQDVKRVQVTESIKNVGYNIWILYVLMIILTSLLISNIQKNNILNVIWNMWSLFRGTPHEITGLSRVTPIKKMFYGLMLIISFFIISFYNVTMNSEFVVPVKPVIIDSLQDMLDSDKFPLFIDSIPSIDYFKFSHPDTMTGKVWKKAEMVGLNKSIAPVDLKEPFKMLDAFTGNWKTSALICLDVGLDVAQVFYCNANPELKTRRSRNKFARSVYAYLYSKNTSTEFKRRLDRGITKLFESGISTTFWSKNLGRTVYPPVIGTMDCLRDTDSGENLKDISAINMENVVVLRRWFFIGISLALSVFLIEYLIGLL